MTKLFALYKRSYGDFDIARHDTVAVSDTKEHLKIECAALNARRTEADLLNEVEYSVSDKREVRLL
jgi:hypothetical protein